MCKYQVTPEKNSEKTSPPGTITVQNSSAPTKFWGGNSHQVSLCTSQKTKI